MKLTDKDKEYLLSIGHPEEDLSQIEEAMSAKKTTYTLTVPGQEEQPIAREKAIQILGRETFLSGLGRSAFHSTALRNIGDGAGGFVSFDSSALFGRG